MYSRQSFLKVFDQLLSLNSQNEGKLGFLIVKFKRFKDINAAYGFRVGDAFIEHGGDRLKAVLRANDVMSRFSDNEFALLLPGLHNSSHAVLAANKIVSECSAPVMLHNVKIEPRLTVGIVIAPDHGADHDELIHRANLALSEADNNSDHYSMYSPDKDGPATMVAQNNLPPRLILEQELHYAFDHDEFCLHYQPKIDLKKKNLAGSEVLIRWNSSKYGQVDTESFIEVLEGSGLLFPVTKWILNSALRQCEQCAMLNNEFSLSVNLSPALLNDRGIVDIVRGAIKIWNTPPERLVLEVTENAIMGNPEASILILHELKSLGVSISIDDFGTGLSSLTYLKDMPATELKIDKSFVMQMLDGEKNTSIVKSTIDLAHSLGMHVIAEGIENEQVLNRLIEMGCDYGQGFLMGYPMPYEKMLSWMNESSWAGP